MTTQQQKPYNTTGPGPHQFWRVAGAWVLAILLILLTTRNGMVWADGSGCHIAPRLLLVGYGTEHKTIGSQNTHSRADRAGYITTGLLRTPGLAVIDNNGKVFFRWENTRVSDVQSYIMDDMASGSGKTLPPVWTVPSRTTGIPTNERTKDHAFTDNRNPMVANL